LAAGKINRGLSAEALAVKTFDAGLRVGAGCEFSGLRGILCYFIYFLGITAKKGACEGKK